MKRLIVSVGVLVLAMVQAQAVTTQLNALSWCKANGSDQTANMQAAVNAAAAAGQSLYIPPGIVFNASALTNTANVLLEDYSSPGTKKVRGALEIEGGGTGVLTNEWGGTNVTQRGLGNAFFGTIIDRTNVRWYGAIPDDGIDDTAAIQAAINAASTNKGRVFLPRGTYDVTSLEVNGPSEICGESGARERATIIRQMLGATDDLLTSRANVGFRPTIRDLCLEGRMEDNPQNLRSITEVASRTEFTVNEAPPTGYLNAECFFFYNDSNGYHYLGAGLVTNVVGNVVTLDGSKAWFATPKSADLKLDTSCVVAFGENVTEYIGAVGTTVSDPSQAGLCGIDLRGVGAVLKLRNIRLDGFHVGIRRGMALQVDASDIFFARALLTDYYCPYGGGSDDVLNLLDCNGFYYPQLGKTDLTIDLDNPVFRKTRFGMYMRGSKMHGNQWRIYHVMQGIVARGAFALKLGSVDIDATAFEAITVRADSAVMIDSLELHGIGTYDPASAYVFCNENGTLQIDKLYPYKYFTDTRIHGLVTNETANAHNVFSSVIKSLTYPYIYTNAGPVDFCIVNGDSEMAGNQSRSSTISVSTSDAGYYRPERVFRRARGTMSSPTNVLANDWLGTMIWKGWQENEDGRDYRQSSFILGAVGGIGTNGIDYLPGLLNFYTADATGTNVPSLKLALTPDSTEAKAPFRTRMGAFFHGIGEELISFIAGEPAKFDGGGFTGKLFIDNVGTDSILKFYRYSGAGSDFRPWYIATGGGDTGSDLAFKTGAPTGVGTETNLVDMLRIDPGGTTHLTRLEAPSGTVAWPTYQLGATNTGIYSSAANHLNFALNGKNEFQFGEATAYILHDYAHLKMGTAIDAGLKRLGAASLSVTDGGAGLGSISASSFIAQAGTVSAPAVKVGSANTGIYSAAANHINFALNGVNEFQFGEATQYILHDYSHLKMGASSDSGLRRLAAASLGVSDGGAGFGSLKASTFVVAGTGAQVTFGATNTAPVNTTTPTKWISVQVQGEAATYRMPLYE